jgi:hypothetical protein
MIFKERKGFQDRNVLKFVFLLFLKYDRRYSKGKPRTTRIREIKKAYAKECKSHKDHITLNIFKKIFHFSKFNKENRNILYHILGDFDILR